MASPPSVGCRPSGCMQQCPPRCSHGSWQLPNPWCQGCPGVVSYRLLFNSSAVHQKHLSLGRAGHLFAWWCCMTTHLICPWATGTVAMHGNKSHLGFLTKLRPEFVLPVPPCRPSAWQATVLASSALAALGCTAHTSHIPAPAEGMVPPTTEGSRAQSVHIAGQQSPSPCQGHHQPVLATPAACD